MSLKKLLLQPNNERIYPLKRDVCLQLTILNLPIMNPVYAISSFVQIAFYRNHMLHSSSLESLSVCTKL